MRIKEMVTREGIFWLENKFSLLAPQEIYKNSVENMHTDVRV